MFARRFLTSAADNPAVRAASPENHGEATVGSTARLIGDRRAFRMHGKIVVEFRMNARDHAAARHPPDKFAGALLKLSVNLGRGAVAGIEVTSGQGVRIQQEVFNFVN